MAEPVKKYQSSDVPEFASYPAEPYRARVGYVEVAVVSEFDAMPDAEPTNRFDEQGRQVGIALGRLVNKVNDITGALRSRFQHQMEQADIEMAQAKDVAEQAYDDASRKFKRGARQMICDARAKAGELREITTRTVEEYPVHTLAAVGIAGVIAGVGLRAWKENRG